MEAMPANIFAHLSARLTSAEATQKLICIVNQLSVIHCSLCAFIVVILGEDESWLV